MNDLKDYWKNGELEKAKVSEKDKKAYNNRFGDNSFWKDHPFGRTLTLRNKTGKVGATVLGGIGSTFLPEPFEGWIQKGIDGLITIQTGANMDMLADMSVLQLAIMAAAALILWGLPSIIPQVKEKSAWKIVEARLDDVSDEVVKAVDEDSEKGKKISRNELKAIIGSALKNEE